MIQIDNRFCVHDASAIEARKGVAASLTMRFFFVALCICFWLGNHAGVCNDVQYVLLNSVICPETDVLCSVPVLKHPFSAGMTTFCFMAPVEPRRCAITPTWLV